MTLILGLTSKDYTLLAGDTLAYTEKRSVRVQSKVFQKGDLLFGVAGAVVLLNCLQHHCNIPTRKKGESVETFIFQTVFTAIKKALKKQQLLVPMKEEVDYIPGEFLLAYKGHLFHVQSDLGVVQIKNSNYAIGSGSSYALGVYGGLQLYGPSLGVDLKADVKVVQQIFSLTAKYSQGVNDCIDIVAYKNSKK